MATDEVKDDPLVFSKLFGTGEDDAVERAPQTEDPLAFAKLFGQAERDEKPAPVLEPSDLTASEDMMKLAMPDSFDGAGKITYLNVFGRKATREELEQFRPDAAAEAGILHDITKKLSLDEQLILCGKYGIINDNAEKNNVKLLHAKTGAAEARDLFGVSDAVYGAIRWHTTGKPDMTLLEKIIYLADYIEPNRDFPGLAELRRAAYEDIDAAMALGLEMSLADIRSYGEEPHRITAEAYEWYSRKDK